MRSSRCHRLSQISVGPRHGVWAATWVLFGGALASLGGCTAVEEQSSTSSGLDASATSCNQPMQSDPTDETDDPDAAADGSGQEQTADASTSDDVDESGPDASDELSEDDATADDATAYDAGSTGDDSTVDVASDAGGDASQPSGEAASPDAEAGAVPGCGSLCGSVSELQSEGNEHVEVGSVVDYGHNPPASGSHYPYWAKYGAYEEVVPRSYWVHNLEHGTIVLLYGPDATDEQQAELRAVYDALPDDPACGHKRALLTPDPDLDDAIAVVSWGWVLEGSCVDSSAILAFVEAHRGQGLEAVCGDGSFSP